MKILRTLLVTVVASTISISAVAQGKSPKRGVGTNAMYEADYAALAPATTWFYNWGLNPPGGEGTTFTKYDIEFCPMTWNSNFSYTTIDNVVAKYPDNINYILGFNEPNFSSQANLSPSAAANIWKTLGPYVREKGLKVVSPAVNYGTIAAYNDPVVWLDEFFSYLPNGVDDVDYIACHFYMPNVGALKGAVDRLKKYGKPIWLTEFCLAQDDVISNDMDTQIAFMLEAFEYLEKDPDIYRYAWFMARTGNTGWSSGINLLKSSPNYGQLTDIGKVYVNFPTFNEEYYHQINTLIPAVQYIDALGVSMYVTNDIEGESDVDLTDLGDLWTQEYVTYNVEIPSDGVYTIDLRMAAGSSRKLTIKWDGEEVATDVKVGTGGNSVFGNNKIDVTLKAGKHKLQLLPSLNGSMRIHEFKITASAGIDGVVADGAVPFEVVGTSIVSEEPVQVYNLQGAEVGCDNLASGVYVVVYAGGSTKIAIP